MKAGLKARLIQEFRDIALKIAPPGIDHFQFNAQVVLGPLAQSPGIALIPQMC